MPDSLLPAISVLRQKMHNADPVADRVASLIAKHGAHGDTLSPLKAVELLLRTPRFNASLLRELCPNHEEFTHACTEFLKATSALPKGHSDADIAAGNRLFEDNAVFGFVCLGCASLLECYGWDIEAEVLGITHGLVKNIDRRIPETAMYMLNVMTDKAILEKGHTDASAGIHPGEDQTPLGVRAIQKIRLLHALMRWLIKFDPKGAGDVFEGPLKDNPFALMMQKDWPAKEKGQPISQAFLAGTLLTFSLTIINGMRRMLVPVSDVEARQYLHRWQVIGFKMGVDAELLAYFDNEKSANRLHAAMMDEFRGPTTEGKLMAATLENYMIRNIVDRVPFHKVLQMDHMPRVVMWNLAGRNTCRVLDLEPGLFGRTLGWVGWQCLRLVGFLKRIPLLKKLSQYIFEWLTRVMWGWRREEDTAPQRPKQRGVVISCGLADRWGVPKESPSPSGE